MSTVQPLCARCQNLALHQVLRDSYQQWKESDESDLSLDVSWYSSLAELTSSLSESRCVFCQQVRQGLEASLRYEVADQEASGDAPLKGLREDNAEDPLHRIDGYLDFPIVMSLRLLSSVSTIDDSGPAGSDEGCQKKKHANAFLSVSISSGVSWGLTLQAEFRLVTGYDDPLAESILGRTIARAPDSDHAFSVIDSWMKSCLNDHHLHCLDTVEPPPLPTRVIDVTSLGSDSTTVCLRDNESKVETSADYIALSHCWGKGIPFITTTDNLTDRKRGICVSDMPQVLQDAILITRRLGKRYIWIDTLCIIQDDLRDWQVEAGRMVAVYRDAFMVIGASNSSADDCGFLYPREQQDLIQLVDHLPDGQTSFLDLQLLPPAGERWTSGRDPVSHEPLQSRAWCLQERYLSQRMLLYGAEQLFWECRTVTQAEDGDVMPQNLHHLDRLRKTAASDMTIFGPRPDGDSQVNYRGWYEMVEEYMRRNITVQSDRLPALSGLANAMAQKSKDVYLAGLWKKGLIEGLLWCGGSQEKPLKKATTYLAPSWSWVSNNGPVQFIVYSFFERCKWKRAIANYEALAEFVDHKIEAGGLDPYGSVLHGGYLRLRAPLLPVKGIYPAENSPPSSEVLMTPLRNPILDRVVEVTAGNKSFYLQAGFDPDTESEIPIHQQQLFVLFLARLPDGNTGFSPFMDHRFCLLVRPSDNDSEVYERVGVIDSPVLKKENGGMWMVVLRVLEKLLRYLERLSGPAKEKPISFLTPQLFLPGKALQEEPEEEMPADPLPEIKQHSVNVTLV